MSALICEEVHLQLKIAPFVLKCMRIALRWVLEAPALWAVTSSKCINTPTGLILISHILSYPKAVSDSMQKEIGQKGNKKRRKKNESKRTRSTERKYWDCYGHSLWEKLKQKKTYTYKTSGTCTAECGEMCLLLACSWCRGLREASGRWSVRWRRQERLRLCREAAAWSYTLITFFF